MLARSNPAASRGRKPRALSGSSAISQSSPLLACRDRNSGRGRSGHVATNAWACVRILQEFRQLFRSQAAIPGGSVQKTGADDVARVCRHNCAAAILMLKKMMAAFDANDQETGVIKGGNEVGASDARNPAHAAIVTRWTPTNSRSCSGAPSTSRHSPMTSRMRSVTSSRDRACV